MSIERFFVRPVIILNPAYTTDGYGNQIKDWGTATETNASVWLHQRHVDELLGNREAQVSRWRVRAPLDTPLAGDSRIQHGDVLFEVDGPPHEAWTPDGAHHLVANLLVVEG